MVWMIYNLRALQIFECVSRHNSVAEAAKELKISPSAISHQLKKLSEQVGENLFDRSGRRMVLSASGTRLASSLTLAFDQIDESVNTCIGTENETLRIAMCSTFGAGWFIRRLGTFLDKNPEVSIQTIMYSDDPVRVAAASDGFITIFPPDAGYWSLNLFDEMLTAVASPDYIQDRPLSATSFITTHLDRTTLAADWRDYFKHASIDMELRREQIVQVSHEIFALEAAKQGIGVALLPTFLASEALAGGMVVAWHEATMPSGRSYSFCTKSARRFTRSLDKLTKWLYAEKRQGLASNDSAFG